MAIHDWSRRPADLCTAAALHQFENIWTHDASDMAVVHFESSVSGRSHEVSAR
jgi:hypothetical protein